MKISIEEKNIKIAEACGWRECPCGKQFCCYRMDMDGGHTMPDYFNDLNACHEMEMSLTEDQRKNMRGWMATALKDAGHDRLTPIVHAAAAQRAEAFGLTLGLWGEGE